MENEQQARPEVGSIYVDNEAQFYEVIKVTEKSITLRPIEAQRAGEIESNGDGYNIPFLPCPGKYTKARVNYELTDKPFTRKFSGRSGYYAYSVPITRGCNYAMPWDGKVSWNTVDLGR